jgi:ribosomal protein S18 acetylase RimI-like enzyme
MANSFDTINRDTATGLNLASSISLRTVVQSDTPSLQAMYNDSRAKEMQHFPFTGEQAAQFLQMQFAAQHQHYRSHYPNASYDCVLLGTEIIGRLYVNRENDDIQLIDILLFSSHCNQGIGSYLLNQLIIEANDSNRRITAHVEFTNPARHLYQRLGFIEVKSQDPYIFIAKNSSTAGEN